MLKEAMPGFSSNPPEAEAKILAASPKPEDRSHPYEV